ncbi:alpha/beta fold hydrolase [Thermobispora bispora]|jgi:ABC-2 type transport system ATP-binding protein|uniref:alpha/beta fold hydrolase n=1 Tax=Thermobispora bispora TaxID=2006 RepID=UPI0019816365|nr:alpha/beta fold hydrolase [Thermobispora bispora]MBO2475649.1 ABC transporter ATP-binding protein [Actinomycetales bacterium]MDI9581400.1 alpha/beta fold hydrolase [Thermobispora sp.]QSI48760.1 alpha/beta fold hydrolase [Thermobispora bispora]
MHRMTFARGRRALAAAITLAVLVAGALLWALWPSPRAVAGTDVTITVMDGPAGDQRVRLDATFFPPASGGPAPAVLLAHGFGGSKESVRPTAERLAARGYAVLTWSARGFGRSTGEIALNSPDYEVKDVRQLIDWLAKRPEVRLDAPGDPRVGIAGASYGGAIALMTAAYDARVDAIAPQSTWHDLADALFPDAGGRGPLNGVFKKMWAGIFFGGAGAGAAGGDGDGAAPGRREDAPVGQTGLSGGLPELLGALPEDVAERLVRCGRFRPEICEMYHTVASTGRATKEAVELLRRSSPVSVPGRIRIPTLIIHGQRDSLFPLSHADANALAIAATGAPVEVVWIDGGHDGGDAETDYVFDRTAGWFDRWLRGGTGDGTGAAFTVTRDGGRDPGTRQRVLVHASADRYPGLSGSGRTTVALSGPPQPVANPPGGSPAGISSLPGLGGLLTGGSTASGFALDMPGQAAVFQSEPLARAVRVTGSPSVTLRVHGTGEATLFVKLYESAGSASVLPAGLAAPLRVAATEAGTPVTVTLPAIDHLFEAGSRLRLVVSTTDMAYATPAAPAVHRIALGSPEVTLPVHAALTTPAGGPDWWLWALPVAAVVIAAALLLTGRRGTAAPQGGDTDPELADVPLVIRGLGKRYRNGEQAVADLSFRVERGQVLGLLGPNGAGKTTTLRMLMGLIHPDEGEIRIFGTRVTPGAPVLSRLGSFVEGPGFLPHLSGRDNLELYWRATGRPPGDAHLEEALEIAGLGDALDRPVRTYSQGMRQRLAIAQAMLGLPDLLVLDEPTNGLDPPQIAEMRKVLKAYAERGRTVIISSHLLAEVEQTCSHVVVMHRGRLVSAGPVRELLKRGGPAGAAGAGPRLEDVFLELIGER